MELRLPNGYGYANRGTDIWGLVYMLMNHRNAASTVHVQYRIQYVTGEPRTPVKPVWLDVVNCYADPIFTVPGTGGPGSSFVRTSDFTMPESGRLVSGGAHIHGGGQRIELRNATCSTVMADTTSCCRQSDSTGRHWQRFATNTNGPRRRRRNGKRDSNCCAIT